MNTIFIVETPVIEYTGESAGIGFHKGRAEVAADTQDGLSALRYFRGAGYRIYAKDENGPALSELLDQPAGDALAEAAAIQAEIKQLEARRDLEDLRGKRDALRREVLGKDEAAALEPGTTPVEIELADPATGPAEAGQQQGEGALLAPPAANAGVADWRAWAVESGRAGEDDVATKSRTELQNTLGADYDRDREAQLKGGASE